MPSNREPLTDRQYAVLQWIADGCPDGVWPDHSHKLSVGALETRNLASVRRRYGKWSAILRPEGEYYLKHGTYPGQGLDDGVSVPPGESGSAADALPRERPPSPAERLIADVIEAGGSLAIKIETYDEEGGVRARAQAAQKHGKVPSGKELVVDRPNWKTFVLNLVAIPEWSAAPIEPVEVSATLRRPHAAVCRLRQDPKLLGIHGSRNRMRALRILQSIVRAMTARGHAVAPVKETDHLRFAIVGHEIGLRLTQLNDRSDHVPTKEELADRERWSWTRIPTYDYTPSERLKIELTGYHGGAWSDGKRRQLESRLDKIVHALERASATAERARLAHLERERQAKFAEEQRIVRATERMVRANRVEVFDEQLVAWLRSRQIADYLTEMETVIERIEDSTEGVAAGEWLAWCREHARAIDPLQSALRMPADPAPNHANLAPFLERPSYGFMRA